MQSWRLNIAFRASSDGPGRAVRTSCVLCSSPLGRFCQAGRAGEKPRGARGALVLLCEALAWKPARVVFVKACVAENLLVEVKGLFSGIPQGLPAFLHPGALLGVSVVCQEEGTKVLDHYS